MGISVHSLELLWHQHIAFHQHTETKEETTNSLCLLHRIIYLLPFRQDLIVNILDQRKRKVGADTWVSLQWHTEGASHWKRGNARFRCWCLQHHTRSCWTAADRGELWERGRFTVRSRSFVVFPLDPPTLPLACLLSTDKLIRQGLAWKGVVTFPPLFVLSP